MSDESNIPPNLEQHKEVPVEVEPKEQEQLPVAEGHETQTLQQRQEKGEWKKEVSFDGFHDLVINDIPAEVKTIHDKIILKMDIE